MARTQSRGRRITTATAAFVGAGLLTTGMSLVAASSAQAAKGPSVGHIDRVWICKSTRTPGTESFVAHVQSADGNSLDFRADFVAIYGRTATPGVTFMRNGQFGWPFADAQRKSIAVTWVIKGAPKPSDSICTQTASTTTTGGTTTGGTTTGGTTTGGQPPKVTAGTTGATVIPSVVHAGLRSAPDESQRDWGYGLLVGGGLVLSGAAFSAGRRQLSK